MSRAEFNDLAGKFGKGGLLGMPTDLDIGWILAAVGAAAYGVTPSLYTVDGDHRAHIPSYMIFDLALGRSHHPSKDLQMINISLGVVMSSPESLRLASLHRNLGSYYDEKVLPLNERIYLLKINE